jgi:CRISPR system Cascade subunit CasD
VSRSGALGIVAAALGIRRDDADGWAELDRSIGFASRTDAPGELLIDFHTAQGPEEKLLRAEAKAAKKAGLTWQRPATRKAELAYRRQVLDTLLSSRQYRVDALWTVALWQRSDVPPGRWTLGALAEALRSPHFVPYLGRKSCPLDVPMEPQTVEAADPVAAMARAVFQTDDLLRPVLERGAGRATVHWEGDWDGLEPEQTVRRRDRVSSRARWQFAERDEHQKAWNPQEGGRRVSEPG